MDIAQGLLEIEVLIFFRRGDADVAAGGETPVGGLDLRTVDQLDQPRHGLQLGVREAVLQPRHLPVKVGGALELFDGRFALLIELLNKFCRGAAVVGGGDRFIDRKLGAQVRDARGELVEEVHLFDQTADRLGVTVERRARRVLLVVLAGQGLGVLLAEGAQAGEEFLPVRLVERGCLAQLGRVGKRRLLVGFERAVLLAAPARRSKRPRRSASVVSNVASAAIAAPLA